MGNLRMDAESHVKYILQGLQRSYVGLSNNINNINDNNDNNNTHISILLHGSKL